LRPRQFTRDLGQALHDLAREFQQNSSIQTDVQTASDLPAVEPEVGVALYVITHEALSNTRKYAQASKVTIRLFTESGSLCLEVRDDGRGFDPASEIPQSHRGLRNMASRASLVGAELFISSAPELGTAIQVELGLTSSTSSS
jgi:signal transduction histidine kinase